MTLLAGLLALAVAAPPKPAAELTPSGVKPADRWHPAWLGFSPDGKSLVARYTTDERVDTAEVLVWWAVAGWKEQRKLGAGAMLGDPPDAGPAVALVADDGCVVTTTGGVRVLSSDKADSKRPLILYPSGVWVGADGRTAYAFVGTPGRLVSFSCASTSRQHREVLNVPAADRRSIAALDPAARLLAVVTGLNAVEVWDVPGKKRTARLTGHKGAVACLAFSPDGQTLATGGTDTTLRLWDTATGQERATLTGPLFTVTAVAFSGDGKWLAFVTTDRGDKPNLWLADPVACAVTARVVTGTTGQLRVAVSPDGKLVATSGLDEAVRVWDVERLVAGGG